MSSTMKTDAKGNHRWYKEGRLHRGGDLPAIISADGERRWFKNGSRHRDNDLPAVVYPNGNMYWHQNNLPHRVGDSAVLIVTNEISFWEGVSEIEEPEIGKDEFYLEGIEYEKKDYWKEVGKIYGLVIRDKVKI